ncbi:MAG: hypothetical protein ACHQNT_10655 [Bacteroidia bacterium]
MNDTNIQNSMTWQFKKKKVFLKKNNKVIIELKTGKKKRASFKWKDKAYTIRNRGFWNPVTVLEEGNKQVLILKRFFRDNKAFIEFENGNRYLCKSQNPLFVKLSVYSNDRKEIIRYKLNSKSKASMHLNTHADAIPETDLIFLIVLSCFVFMGILKENNTDVDSVVFSNTAVPVPGKEEPVSEPILVSEPA